MPAAGRHLFEIPHRQAATFLRHAADMRSELKQTSFKHGSQQAARTVGYGETRLC
ncbi:hypothetical protein J3R73_001199 [Labrys monachus]|uniref:Uncharacterized protein n=1 Tax=Labrys monachus TaxID=217067 RepID=A0ABU0F9V9_9HYPH|nr:hypothetical protein [Labrys monachus]